MLLVAGLCFVMAVRAQNDTTTPKPQSGSHGDTIRIGEMIIIKNGNGQSGDGSVVHVSHRHNYKPSNVSTNWIILDFGFTNYTDNTNYSSSAAQSFAPGSTSDWFNLRNNKSVDVNIWLFMQRLNMVNHVLNLKYGLGIELNNYRYSSPILYSQNPNPLISYDTQRHYSKNKLAADYLTVPLMLNFNFTPHRKEGFGFSVGASAGYLYNSRQKTVTAEDGKQKSHNSYNLDPWKISWIAEVQLGPIKLYGSLATKSMFDKGLDQIPYTFGLRFSNW